jgi:hypothetical protein
VRYVVSWPGLRGKGTDHVDDFVVLVLVLVLGTKSAATTIRAEIGEVLAQQLKMTLSAEKTHMPSGTRMMWNIRVNAICALAHGTGSTAASTAVPPNVTITLTTAFL